MHLRTEDLTRIEIEYDSGVMPPPYSHIFKLKIGFGKNFLDTQLDLVYTDREEITEDEILNEGFSVDDDFHFQGEIPKVWEKPLRDLYAKSKWSNKKLDEEGGIKLLAKDSQGQIVRTIPLNQEEWQFLSQDYIQAIYEITQGIHNTANGEEIEFELIEKLEIPIHWNDLKNNPSLQECEVFINNQGSLFNALIRAIKPSKPSIIGWVSVTFLSKSV